LFAKAQSLNEPVLIRIVQNRMTVENKRILDEIQEERCQGRVEVTIPRDSRNGIPERERSIDKTTTLIFMYSIIAVILLNMTYAARLTPELPCSLVLGEDEWKLLYCAADKTKKEPPKPYSIKEAVDYPGRLGGPKRSPGDGPPGVKTGWVDEAVYPV
jgi:hypothetical protein